MSFYPMMFNLKNKNCTFIGGGEVAERKIKTIMEYEANILVISPNLTGKLKDLEELGLIKYKRKEYNYGDLTNTDFAFVAVDDIKTAKLCIEEGKEKNIPINAASLPECSDFFMPATINKGSLTISVSTNGKLPILSRIIREELEKEYGDLYIDLINTLADIRKDAIIDIREPKIRNDLLIKLIDYAKKSDDKYIIENLWEEYYILKKELGGLYGEQENKNRNTKE